jgi:hypothetical protein
MNNAGAIKRFRRNDRGIGRADATICGSFSFAASPPKGGGAGGKETCVCA